MSKLTFGVVCNHCTNIRETIENVKANNLNFATVPLFHPRLRRDVISISSDRDGTETRSDLALTCNEWTSNIVGMISEWIDCDNRDNKLRLASEKVLNQEFSWAIHLGLQVILLPGPSPRSCINYARCLMQLAAKSSNL